MEEHNIFVSFMLDKRNSPYDVIGVFSDNMKIGNIGEGDGKITCFSFNGGGYFTLDEFMIETDKFESIPYNYLEEEGQYSKQFNYIMSTVKEGMRPFNVIEIAYPINSCRAIPTSTTKSFVCIPPSEVHRMIDEKFGGVS